MNGKKLTEIINTTHINAKYLPGIQLPDNVVAVPDVVESIRDATALVFVLPHQCELYYTCLCHVVLTLEQSWRE